MAARFLAKQPVDSGSQTHGFFGWANMINCMSVFTATGGPHSDGYCTTAPATDSGPPIGKVGTNTDKQWFAFDFNPVTANSDETNIFLAWGDAFGVGIGNYCLSLYVAAGTANWVIALNHVNNATVGALIGSYNMGPSPGWQHLRWERDESDGSQEVCIDDVSRISGTDNTSPEPSMDNIYHRHGVTNEKWSFSLAVSLANFIWNNDEAVAAADEWTTALANGVETGLETVEGVSGTDHRLWSQYITGCIGPDTDPDFDDPPDTNYTLTNVYADADALPEEFTGVGDAADKWKNVDDHAIANYNYATSTGEKQVQSFPSFSPAANHMILAVAACFTWWQDPPVAVWAGNYMVARRNGGALERSAALTDDVNCEEAWFGTYMLATCPTAGGEQYLKSFAETASMSETLTSTITFARSFAESLGMSEAWARKLALHRSFAEALDLAEALARKTGVSIGEALGLVETFSERFITRLSFAESLSLAEAWSRVASFRRSISESLSLAESWTRKASFYRVFVEAASLAEALTARFITHLSFAESLSFSEALSTLAKYGAAPAAIVRLIRKKRRSKERRG